MKGTGWGALGGRGLIPVLRAAAALAAALTLSACGGSSAPAAQARVPSTTIPPADPYAVPAHITPAYVQRVLDALDAVDGDATRLIVANRALVKPALYRLEAIDSQSWFGEMTNTWAGQIAQGLTNYQASPANKRDAVQHLISSSRSCIFVKVTTDYSAVARSHGPPQVNYIVLRPSPPPAAYDDFNPTPWVIDLEGYNSQGLEPSDPCVG